ncbi:MAG: DUF2062 domain-containing protein [Bacteroidetes bacterium]|nr:DUF2062 domain-containing protein [Bacteroidota bacterium]
MKLPFLKKFADFLKQGATPKALAISATVGLLLGIIPVIGVTTVLMAGIAVRFRLNLPLMLGLSYVIYPLQILLLIPFVRIGEWLSGTPPIALSLDGLETAFQADFMAALLDLGAANLLAVAGWGVTAIPVGAMVYGLLTPVFQVLVKRDDE